MRISQEADYAIRVVVHLSQVNQYEIVAAKTIADQEAISLPFLLKLLRKLIQAGIVKSFRGIKGGYSLAKAPEAISLRDVIEAIDGPICLNACLADADNCNKRYTPHCKAHQTLRKVNHMLVKELERIDFRSILQQN